MQRLKAPSPISRRSSPALVADRRETDVDVTQSVLTILGEIRARGDDALAEFTMRYDDFAAASPPASHLPEGNDGASSIYASRSL